MMNKKITLLPCAQCGTPVAEVQNGVLVIKSRHHGKVHVTTIQLTTIPLFDKVCYNEVCGQVGVKP